MEIEALTVVVGHFCVSGLPAREEVARLSLCSRSLYAGTTKLRDQVHREWLLSLYTAENAADMFDGVGEGVYEWPLYHVLKARGLLGPDCKESWLCDAFANDGDVLLEAFKDCGVLETPKTAEWCAEHFKNRYFQQTADAAGIDTSGLNCDWFAERMQGTDLLYGLQYARKFHGPHAPSPDWLASHFNEDNLEHALSCVDQFPTDVEWYPRYMSGQNLRWALIKSGIFDTDDAPDSGWLAKHGLKEEDMWV